MLAGIVGPHKSRIVGRPGNAWRLAQPAGHVVDEIAVVIGRQGRGSSVEKCRPRFGQGRGEPARHVVAEAAANHGPVAQALGDSPEQAETTAADLFDLIACGAEDGLRALAQFARQNDHELFAAAGAHHQPGKAQLGYQRARQHFGQEIHPVRTPADERFLRGAAGQRAHGRQQKVARAEESSLYEDLDGHPFGDRTAKLELYQNQGHGDKRAGARRRAGLTAVRWWGGPPGPRVTPRSTHPALDHRYSLASRTNLARTGFSRCSFEFSRTPAHLAHGDRSSLPARNGFRSLPTSCSPVCS